VETAIRLTLWIYVLAGTSLIAIWILYYRRRFNAPKARIMAGTA
jgi:hypothetical protein